jgi:hypothetical protein
MLIALRKTSDWIHAVDGNPAFKALNILAVLGTLVTIGIALF